MNDCKEIKEQAAHYEAAVGELEAQARRYRRLLDTLRDAIDSSYSGSPETQEGPTPKGNQSTVAGEIDKSIDVIGVANDKFEELLKHIKCAIGDLRVL